MVKMEGASCPSCERKVDTRGKAMLQLESLALLASSSVELQLLEDALLLLSLLLVEWRRHLHWIWYGIEDWNVVRRVPLQCVSLLAFILISFALIVILIIIFWQLVTMLLCVLTTGTLKSYWKYSVGNYITSTYYYVHITYTHDHITNNLSCSWDTNQN